MTGEPPFGRMVRERMRMRGTGLRELCRSVGVDPSFFSKVLASKRSPPAEDETLRRVARALEMDETRLIVAAGRVPAEWRRLWTDDELFRSVHSMATGERERISSPVRTPANRLEDGWGTGGKGVLPSPSPRLASRRELEDELL